MIRVYCRCNGGDYFVGEGCPFDGWSSAESKAIAHAARRIANRGVAPSIAALREEGLDDTALMRTVLIEFGSEESVFDAFQPGAFIVDGRLLTYKDLGPNLT